ncbi:hypothetical protein C8R45DRAFT_948062 [Mycena sanguinolenta]|nr:hypothetical protein C8R45DRAFT_948062 [Mycena sanguinolenta]
MYSLLSTRAKSKIYILEPSSSSLLLLATTDIHASGNLLSHRRISPRLCMPIPIVQTHILPNLWPSILRDAHFLELWARARLPDSHISGSSRTPRSFARWPSNLQVKSFSETSLNPLGDGTIQMHSTFEAAANRTHHDGAATSTVRSIMQRFAVLHVPFSPCMRRHKAAMRPMYRSSDATIFNSRSKSGVFRSAPEVLLTSEFKFAAAAVVLEWPTRATCMATSPRVQYTTCGSVRYVLSVTETIFNSRSSYTSLPTIKLWFREEIKEPVLGLFSSFKLFEPSFNEENSSSVNEILNVLAANQRPINEFSGPFK